MQAEIKAALIALTNIPLDKPCYIFIDTWTVANDLAIWTATWKSTDWQIKDKSTWVVDCGNKLWLLIELFGH